LILVVFGIQGNCRRQWLRAKETNAKWRQRCQESVKSEEIVLLAKLVSKYLL
jgi:hypothetical protein